jgi:hypothetical protein
MLCTCEVSSLEYNDFVGFVSVCIKCVCAQMLRGQVAFLDGLGLDDPVTYKDT